MDLFWTDVNKLLWVKYYEKMLGGGMLAVFLYPNVLWYFAKNFYPIFKKTYFTRSTSRKLTGKRAKMEFFVTIVYC